MLSLPVQEGNHLSAPGFLHHTREEAKTPGH